MREEDIQFGQYYQQPGHEPVLALNIERGRASWEEGKFYVWCQSGNQRVGYELGDFLAEFTLVPNYAQVKAERANQLMAELTTDQLDTQQLQQRLAALAVPAQGLLGAGDSTETGLTSGNDVGVPQVEAMKKQVSLMRNEVQKAQLRMAKKNDELRAIVAEQAAAIQAQMDSLNKMVKSAQETIWTFNLYLGKDETIEQLLKGEPCPAGTRITLMQKVLHMDEESALQTLTKVEDGIDALNIPKFIEWLLEDDAHARQMLPRDKGVVAIRPRRRGKKYEDPWTQQQMDKANAHTYFLIRNGGNLYLLDTDMDVADVMFPKEDEFIELFEKQEYETDKRGRRVGEQRVPLMPGTKEYMAAMEKAQAKERHYLRVFLLLQGLLDRTPIFQPCNGPRVNVFDMHRQDDYIEFYRDAEEKKQLPTGRPSFHEWQAAVNANMTVGMRVVGHYKSYDHGHGRDSGESRTYPPNARNPKDEEIYTIERTEAGNRLHSGETAFVFLYDRDEEVRKTTWSGRPYYEEPQRRASCRVYKDDPGIICFDLASVEDMEYYLQSRTERKEYANMVPVLQKAIALKKKEAKAEQPFVEALAGALLRDHALGAAEAHALTAELVTWWKFKNRTHRALLSDDTKASEMILKEAAIRLRRAKQREGAELPVDKLLAAYPDALTISHVEGNDYVVLVPENTENVFVKELHVLLARGTTLKVKEERRWRTVNEHRLGRWERLHTSPRFSEWRRNVQAAEFLTDPERQQLFDFAMEKMKSLDPAVRKKERSTWDKHGPWCLVPLIATLDDEEEFRLIAQTSEVQYPSEDRVLTGAYGVAEFHQVSLGWERGPKGALVITGRGLYGDTSPGGLSWKADDIEDRLLDREGERIFWMDRPAIDALLAEERALDAMRTLRDELKRRWHQPITQQVSKELEKRREIAEFNKFIQEYGDPELFDQHLKQLKLDRIWVNLDDYLDYLIERDVDVCGWTVEKILQEGWKLAQAEPGDEPTFPPEWEKYPLDLEITCEAEGLTEDATAE